MNSGDLDLAISTLCKRFTWHCDVEILVVGGAAGMLTGVFSAERMTGDCDVISYSPEKAWVAVELLADEIGKELHLPESWLNSNVQMRTDALPDDWKGRRIFVACGDRLHVYAASRLDLLAMKFLAHRPQDLKDLNQLSITQDDKRFVRAYLARLPAKGTPADQIAEANELLEAWPAEKK